MEAIKKYIRIAKIVLHAIMGMGIAFVIWGFLVAVFHNCENVDNLLSCGWGVYVIVVLLIVFRNVFHKVKWHTCKNPTKMYCPQCHTIVQLTRYGEERYLKAPLVICIPKRIQFFSPQGDNVLFYKIAYRPYLQLDCPECGEKRVICPYCHEPIPQESVVCKYDKPSKCPHCGKKIYTPVPVQDWDDAIIIG